MRVGIIAISFIFFRTVSSFWCIYRSLLPVLLQYPCIWNQI